MWRPSLTSVISVAFLAYMANSMWSLASLYLPPSCDSGCMKNILFDNDKEFLAGVRFVVMTTSKSRPSGDKDMAFLTAMDIPDPLNEEGYSEEVTLKLPDIVTKKNGTQYLCLFSLPVDPKAGLDKAKIKWSTWIRHEKSTFSIIALTKHHIPEAETFQLLGDEEESSASKVISSTDNKQPRIPVVHIRSKIKVSIMTEDIGLPRNELPPELYHLVRMANNGKNYLPLVFFDELSMRIRDLNKLNNTETPVNFTIDYSPISFGKVRLFSQFTSALGGLNGLGFTDKDTDEVKGIFADTNLVLLMVTFGVSAVHLLFDFLAFKNEISFWRNRTSMEGLSTTTLIWRAFSQSIIFLYLFDEETSLLVLIPSGIAALIEMWKLTKAFRVTFTKPKGAWYYWPELDTKQSKAEQDTKAYDSESMTYLSYILYPLCIGGAIYSLLYTPHKSWWSWTISSMVNGVYAFGFLFMLPQLFVNYKLKSVAHLPWRAFMYKAFNTFIDDLFAFIITMPTAHRVACFRDDIVFLIYLYQRYCFIFSCCACALY
jgi:hypothetical protein